MQAHKRPPKAKETEELALEYAFYYVAKGTSKFSKWADQYRQREKWDNSLVNDTFDCLVSALQSLADTYHKYYGGYTPDMVRLFPLINPEDGLNENEEV